MTAYARERSSRGYGWRKIDRHTGLRRMVWMDKGSDAEFARGPDAPMHRIDTPPFYAATLYPVWHNSSGGLPDQRAGPKS